MVVQETASSATRNQFQQFNVDSNGLIPNNSSGNVLTQAVFKLRKAADGLSAPLQRDRCWPQQGGDGKSVAGCAKELPRYVLTGTVQPENSQAPFTGCWLAQLHPSLRDWQIAWHCSTCGWLLKGR